MPRFPRVFNGLAALMRAAAPKQSWKSRTSQIFSLDKVAINQKSCPSPFQFSQCLPGWGAEAPRRVSSLPLITCASNEAARRGRGSSQPSSCRTGSASHQGRDAAPGLSPRLHSQIPKKISTQLGAFDSLTTALSTHPTTPPLQQLQPCKQLPIPADLGAWRGALKAQKGRKKKNARGVSGKACAVLTCCWL